MADLNPGSSAPSAPAPSTSASTTPAAAPVSAPATTSTPGAPITARQSVEATAARLAAADSPSAENAKVGEVPTTAPTPAETIAQPTNAPNTEPTGAVPPERLPAIVRNAREKAVNELVSSLGVPDVDALRVAADFRNRIAQDPLEFYNQLGQELRQSPEYANRMGQPSTPPQAAATQDPEPQPDLYTEVNGERHEVYSASQLREWQKWNGRQQTEARREEIAPLSEFVRNQQRAEEQRQIREQSRTEAGSLIEDMRAYPHFTKENEPKIAERFANMDPALKKRLGSAGALQRAYNDFLRDEVFPRIDSDAEQRVRGDFTRRASVTSVRPGGGHNTGVRKPTNVAELSAHIKRMSGQ